MLLMEPASTLQPRERPLRLCHGRRGQETWKEEAFLVPILAGFASVLFHAFHDLSAPIANFKIFMQGSARPSHNPMGQEKGEHYSDGCTGSGRADSGDAPGAWPCRTTILYPA
jgi:hypothetical protein